MHGLDQLEIMLGMTFEVVIVKVNELTLHSDF